MSYIIYDNMHIKKSEWENLNPMELQALKRRIFNHYRKEGFPYHNVSVEDQLKQLKQMDKYFESNKVIVGDVIRQTMHCLGTIWTYFPHSWEIRCNKMQTPMEVFNDDELFMKSISKRLKRGTYVTDNGIRKELKTASSTQGVSNFRPSASRAIYDKYAGDGIVYDPSCGFGGRMLGAMSSPKVIKYIGCEPSEKTFAGLEKMTRMLNNDTNIKLIQKGSEEYVLEQNADLAFTSPPYFNTEIYSDEETQSCNKFPEYGDWLDGYLHKTILNTIDHIKTGGYLIINIANTKNAPKLEADFKHIMNNIKSMELKDTLKLSLSLVNNFGLKYKTNKVDFKYEPVFVYKKL